MNRKRLAIFAGSLFVLSLLVHAPARLMGFALADSNVAMSGFSGSLWRGQAEQLRVPLSGQSFQLGQVRWQLSPWSLVLLSPNIQLDTEWGQQRLRAELSVAPWRGPRIHSAELSADARLVRLFVPVDLRGRGQLTLSEVALGKDGMPFDGTARLVWQRASWLGNRSVQPLGDYVLELQVNGPAAADGAISSLSGPVQVSGSVGLQPGTYSVDLMLESETELVSGFKSALELMAMPVGAGYQVQFSGNL